MFHAGWYNYLYKWPVLLGAAARGVAREAAVTAAEKEGVVKGAVAGAEVVRAEG